MHDISTYREILTTLHLPEDRPIDPTLTIRGLPEKPPTIESLPVVQLTEGAEFGELRLMETLGEGGVGVVRRALQAPFDRDVAIKTVRSDRQSDAAVHSLFHEALTTGRLEHPHIIPIYALGRSEGGSPVIVMRRIRGKSWREKLVAGELDLEGNLEILSKVCDAIGFAHDNGVLHRDIKPDNVMLGLHREVYVVDWGIATSCPATITAAAGTPAYMAPEMTEPQRFVDERTDVFLLGAVLYELLCGHPPFSGKSLLDVMFAAYRCEPQSLPTSAPAELVRICAKAMARMPDDRYPGVGAFRQALDRYGRHRDTQRLIDRSKERAEQLSAAVASAEGEHEVIHRLFAEARFGFEEARLAWPDHPDVAGHQRQLLLTMAGFEIDHGTAKAARALLVGLDDVPDDVEARLSHRENEDARHAAEFQALQHMRNELDLGVSSEARALALVALAALWTVIPVIAVWGEMKGYWEITMEHLHTHGLFFFLSIALPAVALRKHLLTNLINQRLILALIMAAFSTVILRSAGYIAAVGVPAQILFEVLTYWVVMATTGILVEPRLVKPAFFYLAAGGVIMYEPRWALLALTLSSALSFLAIARGWAPENQVS